MLAQLLSRQSTLAGVTESKHVPAANTAAVITLAAAEGRRHVAHYIQWSYSAAPTGGRLTVEDGAGNIILDLDITAAGPGGLTLVLIGSANTQMIISLAAGGAAVVGKINAQTTSEAA